MQAIVLAGGLGTRLRGVVPDLPKPLAPVAGRPFLAIVLGRLADAGFARAVLSVGYRHELIQRAFGERFGALALDYAIEDRPLGTGGAIRLAARACSDADVFVLNGDSTVDVDFGAMRSMHLAAAARLTVCAVHVDDTARYGRLQLDGERIAGFEEKGVAGAGAINAGVYLIQRDLLERLGLPEVFSFEADVLAARLAELRPLAFPARGGFIDIGVPQDYARAQRVFALAAAGAAARL
jgi:D-glycero-alpha-D-manno-heptose 1-phosphate guanylyltransferase